MATSGRPSTVRAGGDRAGNRAGANSSGSHAAMDAGGPQPELAVNGGAPEETAAKLEKMLPAGCSPGVIGECDYDSTSADYYFNSYAHFGMCVVRYALVGGRQRRWGAPSCCSLSRGTRRVDAEPCWTSGQGSCVGSTAEPCFRRQRVHGCVTTGRDGLCPFVAAFDVGAFAVSFFD